MPSHWCVMKWAFSPVFQICLNKFTPDVLRHVPVHTYSTRFPGHVGCTEWRKAGPAIQFIISRLDRQGVAYYWSLLGSGNIAASYCQSNCRAITKSARSTQGRKTTRQLRYLIPIPSSAEATQSSLFHPHDQHWRGRNRDGYRAVPEITINMISVELRTRKGLSSCCINSRRREQWRYFQTFLWGMINGPWRHGGWRPTAEFSPILFVDDRIRATPEKYSTPIWPSLTPLWRGDLCQCQTREPYNDFGQPLYSSKFPPLVFCLWSHSFAP